MGIIAILSSPSSFAHNGEMAKIRTVISEGSGIFHYEVEKHKDIAEALTRFQQANAQAIVILGDRALTSATFEHIVEKNLLKGMDIPLAILPAGDNNIVAKNFGATRSEPHLVLKNLLENHQKGNLPVTEVPLIKLEGVRGVGYLYGLFFCAGEVVKQKNLFKRKIYGKSLFKSFRDWLNILNLIQSAYRRSMGKNKLEEVIRINRNQRGAVVGHFFMLLITTLDKSFFGVSIRQEKKQDKAHFISVENTPKAILATGKMMLGGKYDSDHVGNIIAEIQHARIVLQTPFVLDGSYYETDEAGELFVTVTNRLRFIKLS
ncbi:hypothetical protein MNBD_ALPHA03-334 [hydrothermal vent metagenome]|uniref:DAGKc domain-containing protein n=1 Tax=hydrothermal vent metagenome TaxID=652676 RepID=A0A3B1AJY7_9ZZZZ